MKEEKKQPHYKKKGALYKFLHFWIKVFLPKNEVIWQTEKPADGEPTVFICNHTKIYAPVFFLSQDKPLRTWVNCYFFTKELCWNHLKNRVLFGKRKFLRPLGFILTPLIVRIFNCFDFIPVYHFSRELYDVTFQSGVEAVKEGIPQVIFPERTENQVNKYIFEINTGFVMSAKMCYEQTGKKMKFYPVYCAQSIRKVVIGEPIEFDPEQPFKAHRKEIGIYLQNAIEKMGDGLPDHDIVLYG